MLGRRAMRVITSAPSAICGTHLGETKRSRLDIGKAGGGQAVDQLHLDVGGHEFLFILQTVARRYFDDLDAGGQSHVSSCIGGQRARDHITAHETGMVRPR